MATYHANRWEQVLRPFPWQTLQMRIRCANKYLAIPDLPASQREGLEIAKTRYEKELADKYPWAVKERC